MGFWDSISPTPNSTQPSSTGGFWSSIAPATPTTPPATTVNFPSKLGGGAYLMGAQPSDLIKDPRSYAGLAPEAGMQRNHIFPVSLGGASTKENIAYQPIDQATHRDSIEKYVAGEVRKGTMPLGQARVKVLDWENTEIPGQEAWNKRLGGPQNFFTNALGAIGDTVKGFGKTLISPYTQPSEMEKNMEKDIPTILKPLDIPAMRTFAPMLEPIVKDVGAAIVFHTPLYKNLIQSIQTGTPEQGHTADSLIEATNKTAPQIIGDTAQAVLTFYAPDIFGSDLSSFAEKGFRQALTATLAHGAQGGVLFGVSQAASSGSKDPKEIASIITQGAIGGALLNLGIAGISHGLSKNIPDSINKMIGKAPEVKFPPTGPDGGSGSATLQFAPPKEVPLLSAETSKRPGEAPMSVLPPREKTMITPPPEHPFTNETLYKMLSDYKTMSHEDFSKTYPNFAPGHQYEFIGKSEELKTPQEILSKKIKPTKKTFVAKPKSQQAKPSIETKPEIPILQVTGEQKPSGVAKSIEAKAIEAKLTRGFSSVAGYDPLTFKDQGEKASNLINSGIDNARAVIRGEKPLSGGLRGTSLIAGMEEYLKKNPSAEMASELANSPLVSGNSIAAQELGLSRMREADSATAHLQEIKRNLMKKAGGDKIVAQAKKSIISETQKVNLSKEELSWDKFLGSIEC